MVRRRARLILAICLIVGATAACDGGSGGSSAPGEDLPAPLDTAPEVAPDTPCVPACEGPGGPKHCGDDGCGGTCGTCPGDQSCTDDGSCEPECGNGLCKVFENCKSCPQDCGECCGNGTCDGGWGEDCGTCADDCGCDPPGSCREGECVGCLDSAGLEGGFLDTCGDHPDCLFGICVPGEVVSLCSCACMDTGDCPEGWACEISDLFGTDIMFLCQPDPD
ncbi:MAG: hypothetical protein ABIK09_00420 [Pseudomonadota bacterium]